MKKRIIATLGALMLSLSIAATTAPVAVFAEEDDEWGNWDEDGDFDWDADDDWGEERGDIADYDGGDDYTPNEEDGQHTQWAQIHGPSDIHIQEGQSREVTIDVDVNENHGWYSRWSIGNTGIASISGSDNDSASIYASNPGSTNCTIKVYDQLTGDVSASYSFNIYVDRKQAQRVPVTGVSLNTGSKTMTVGDHGQLEGRVYPSNATNKATSWYTSNSDVVEIHGDGVLYAKRAGDATITLRSNDSGDTATCRIHVNDRQQQRVAVSTLGINPTNLAVGIGQSAKIQFQVYPTNASNQQVFIASDNTSVATVTQDGTVTGQRPGTCHIIFQTAEGNKVQKATVTVAQGGKVTPAPAPAPAVAGNNGHDANVQLGYLTQIAKTPKNGTCLINSAYPSAYDVNVIAGMKNRSDVTVVAQFPFQGHTFQMIVPKTFDMTKYAVGGYVDWLTLCNYQAQGVVVKIIK